MVTLPSFFWNNATQRILSQSNNVSYAARGIYRVHKTEDSRKGDYCFRDFDMVMACSYLTELGFRGAETLYAIPLLTEALELDQLAENPLYANARNYRALPSLVRQRVMGSLINKSSVSLVPNLMKELELRQGAELKEVVRGRVEQMLQHPIPQAEGMIQEYLHKNNLSAHADEIRRISGIENLARRKKAMQQLVANHSGLNLEQVNNAVKLEDARHLGILVDHLHRHLNFNEYLEQHYLTDHKLSSTVSDVIQEATNKLDALQTQGIHTKDGLPALLDEMYKLPVAKREAAFNKKFNQILGALELKKGVLIASKDEYNALQQIGEKIRHLLQSENPPVALGPLKEEIGAFYQTLASETSQARHLETLWQHSGDTLKSHLGKKIEEALNAVQTLKPGQDRHVEFAKKLDDLNLEPLVRGGAPALEAFKGRLRDLLPKNATEHVSEGMLQGARKEISELLNRHIGNQVEELLQPLVKNLGEHKRETFTKFVAQSLKSKRMTDTIRKIQANSTWPKMFATVVLNLIFYGFAASNFDNKVLQPFQKKLTAERGTSQEIVTASYLGTIPALAILSQFFDKVSLPAVRRMGYFTRFAAVGGVALAAFAGSTYAILMARLKNSPAPKAVQTAAPQYRPGGALLNTYPMPTPVASPFHAPLPSAQPQPTPRLNASAGNGFYSPIHNGGNNANSAYAFPRH